MCVSEPVKGKLNIKGDRSLKDREALKGHIEQGANQFRQSDKNVTYVSRIQCVKAAIEAQFQEMAQGSKDRKIGVVTFNNEVTVIGDGT
jgi:hypothetical protein